MKRAMLVKNTYMMETAKMKKIMKKGRLMSLLGEARGRMQEPLVSQGRTRTYSF